ncbi:MAG: GbsR/MarR family transcriptional regulator [Anaerolineae bacterium]
MTPCVEEKDTRDERRRFVEDMGLYYEQEGLPRMAGRLVGWLLVCDPPHQSMTELAAALQASKGSISTTSRLLLQSGQIERIALGGDRQTYYRLAPDLWSRLIRERQRRLGELREMADRGLVLLEGQATETRQRLEGMRNLFAYWEREAPGLLARWDQTGPADQGHKNETTAPAVSRIQTGGTIW